MKNVELQPRPRASGRDRDDQRKATIGLFRQRQRVARHEQRSDTRLLGERSNSRGAQIVTFDHRDQSESGNVLIVILVILVIIALIIWIVQQLS